MIHIGLTVAQKSARVAAYCAEHGVKRVYVLSPAKYAFDCGFPQAEAVEWDEIIMYRTFYRLLQEIDASSLVVVNECLRSQNRHDLTYNCIRHFLAQAGHKLVFNWLPCIDEMQDFMVLFDFDTGSKWKREPFDVDLVEEHATVAVAAWAPSFDRIDVPVDAKTRESYAAEKAKLFAGLGVKDPHTIPRNLYLMSGKSKLPHVGAGRAWVGRNDRFKLPGMRTYKEAAYRDGPYAVFELPHNFIDFADVMTLCGQSGFGVLVADLPVDGWYFRRFSDWSARIAEGCAALARAPAAFAAAA